MKKTAIKHPKRAAGFVTGAYTDGVISNGFLFVSGQAAVGFSNSRFVLGTVEEETHWTMNNIKSIVEAAGSTMNNIVKCTVHLSDINDFEKFNAVYTTYFSGVKPARTTVHQCWQKV